MRHPKSLNLGNRDARIADPSSAFTPHYRQRKIEMYYCCKCGVGCDGCASFCRTHLADVILRP